MLRNCSKAIALAVATLLVPKLAFTGGLQKKASKLLSSSSEGTKKSEESAQILKEVDKIKATFTNPLADTKFLREKASDANASSGTHKCFHGRAWLDKFSKQPGWQVYSQGDQDAVLTSLFAADHLGTTNKNFVEFGFPDHDFSTSYGNARHLKEALGFKEALLLDGSSDNPAINLHKSFVTAKNIVATFDQYKVPLEADYVSVDIDSCDLWLFYAITEKYRPRLMTVEYNSNYAWGDYSTLVEDPSPYHWSGDNIYGASLSAIELAAQKRGYSLVYVTPKLDLFLVRSDLLCKDTAVPKDWFIHATSLPMHASYAGKFGPESKLVTDFKKWVAEHP